MAEKEERIEQFITIQQRTITTRDYETNDEIISKIYTRQEAIERMAKALFKVDNVLALDIEFEQLTKQKQLTYKVFAEAALNALLEE